jgi:prevent-host-death family protein
MMEVNVKEARGNFSSLLDRVERGEEIIIKRRGKKIARLISPENDKFLPSLQNFRASIKLTGDPVSKTVNDLRNEERF